MKIEFQTVDVFTNRRFGGNPLAVVPDARGLTGEQMQAIAGEFNLSETTFVLPPENEANTARVRIFTPTAEMPFAGHPNVGTAFVLARAGAVHGRPVSGDTLRFEEAAGLVHMDLARDGREVTGARLRSPQALAVGAELASEAVAQACSLEPGDVETANHRPLTASCGVAFAFAELKSRAALERAAPRTEIMARHLPPDLATGMHLYCRDVANTQLLHARMFAPLMGVVEDPATGSANVALTGLLAHLHSQDDARIAVNVTQGEDMGRPSYMAAEALKEGGRVTATWISGQCVPVMFGEIDLG